MRLFKRLISQKYKVGTVYIPVRLLFLLLLLLILIPLVYSIQYCHAFSKPINPNSHSRKRYQSDIFDPFSFNSQDCSVKEDDLAGDSRQNATILMLARNKDLEDVIKSIMSHYEVFNSVFKYPWTILNDEDFTLEFKEKVLKEVPAHIKIEFGKVNEYLWEFPEVVRTSLEYKESITSLGDKGVYYGQLESYHKMCRFFSGGFYKHPLVRKYEWYWRVEPGVKFYCKIVRDPFDEMKKKGKKYGFVVINEEWIDTIPNLFRITKAWMKKNNISTKSAWKLFVNNSKEKFHKLNEKRYESFYKNIFESNQLKSRANEVVLMEGLQKKVKDQVRYTKNPLLTDYNIPEAAIHELVLRGKDQSRMPTLQGEMINDETYNLKHFWTNFEIARIDLWDNQVYESYFQYLDQSKGFFKERWGDAPIHSLALGFLLDIEEIHYFRDIGYTHTTITHCPTSRFIKGDMHQAKNAEEFGVGCHCECPWRHEEIEDKDDLYDRWFELTYGYNSEEGINLNRIEREARMQLKKQKIFK